MNFGEVLTRSWNIIWKYKVLWIFGILAGLGGGGGGGNGGGGSSGANGNNNGNFNFGGYTFPGEQIQRWLEQNWWVIVAAILAFLVFIVVIIVLSTFGRIGLARGAWQADEGKEKLTLGQLFAECGPYFWRVFGLGLLIGLLWLAFFLIVTVPAVAFAALTAGVALICLGPAFLALCCLLIPVGWAVSVITEQAIVAITCENLGLIDGLKRGWTILRANLASVTVMFLVLGIGGGIVRFLLALPAFVIAAPVVVSAFANSSKALMAGGIVSLVLFCLYLPIALVLGGIVTAYTGTAWALTYRRLTGRGVAAVAAPVVVDAQPLP